MLADAQWTTLGPLIEACRPKGKTPPQVGLPPWCGGGRSEYHAAARMVIASMLARASTGVQ
jgi:hypothetical protein